MHTSRFIHKLSLIIFTFTFIAVQTATAQVPFNRSGSVAGNGVINGTNNHTTGMGMRGIATSATGATKGLYGKTASKSNNAIGVYGFASSNLSTTGFTYGVWGQSNSPKGRGVYGLSNSPSGRGVFGKNTGGGYAGYFDGKFGVKNAFRVYPNATSPNIIGGYKDNSVASGVYGATIGGGGKSGAVNRVTYNYGTVGGGFWNTASGHGSTVGGGTSSNASGFASTVGGGSNNVASSKTSVVAGGQQNGANGLASTVGGGYKNIVSGQYATIGGGFWNIVGGHGSTVGGGYSNSASGYRSTVAGGDDNSASGQYGTVGGGWKNVASGQYSTVAGGVNNSASGYVSTVAGGGLNTASGNYSFAAGSRAKANGRGTFVWADSTSANFAGNVNDRAYFRASGGFLIYTASNLSKYAYLPANATAWVFGSDRNSKEKIVTVDGRDVLDKLANMQVATWQYKGVDRPVRHMGPMSQDFYSAYGLGHDEKGISTIDTDGVALAAIQGLYDVVKEKDAKIVKLQVETAELKSRLLAIESKLGSVANAGFVVSSLEK